MTVDFYLILTWISIGTTLGLGLCFIVLKIPDTPVLNNYRKARAVMACAYFILSALNILELFTGAKVGNIAVIQAMTLSIGSMQAFLFTYTFIALINLKFVTRRKIFYESIVIILFAAITAGASLLDNKLYFKLAIWLFAAYYASLLVRYTLLFLKIYKLYELRMENYFVSETESKRFRWIYFSFFTALLLGTSALLVSLSSTKIFYLLFTIAFICFYAYFGVKFIDYAFGYFYVEHVLTSDEHAEETANPNIREKDKPLGQMEQLLLKWVEQERFLEPGLTIETLARELNTNRTYLSSYINREKQKTFREWINDLRIEKAKELLLMQPDLSISEVSLMTGYTDSSNFNKQFVKNTGFTARVWRIQNLEKTIV